MKKGRPSRVGLGFGALCLLFLFPTIVSGVDFKHLVRGTILSDNGRTLAEARVSFFPLLGTGGRAITTYTDNHGVFSALGLADGSYRVVASKDGYQAVVKERVDLNPRDVKDLTFTLTPIGLLKRPENRSKAVWILRGLNRDILRFGPGDDHGLLVDREVLDAELGGARRGITGEIFLGTVIDGESEDPDVDRGGGRSRLALRMASGDWSAAVKAARYASEEEAAVRSVKGQSLAYEARYAPSRRSMFTLEGESSSGGSESASTRRDARFDSILLTWRQVRSESTSLALRLGCLRTRLGWMDDDPRKKNGVRADRIVSAGADGSGGLEGSVVFAQGEYTHEVSKLGTVRARAEILAHGGKFDERALAARTATAEQVLASAGMTPIRMMLEGQLDMKLFEPFQVEPGLTLYNSNDGTGTLNLLPRLGVLYVPDGKTEMSARVLYNGRANAPGTGGNRGVNRENVAFGYGLELRREFDAVGDLGFMVRVNGESSLWLSGGGVDRSLDGPDFVIVRERETRAMEYGFDFARQLGPGVNGNLHSTFGKAEGDLGLIPLEMGMPRSLPMPFRDTESRFFSARMKTSFEHTGTEVGVLFKWADQSWTVLNPKKMKSVAPTEVSVLDFHVSQGLSFLDFTDAEWKFMIGLRSLMVDSFSPPRRARAFFPDDFRSSHEISGGVFISF